MKKRKKQQQVFFFLSLFSVSSFPPLVPRGGLGVFLVRAAWERRPEGPAYLLSTAMLLYLAVFILASKFPPTNFQLIIYYLK